MEGVLKIQLHGAKNVKDSDVSFSILGFNA